MNEEEELFNLPALGESELAVRMNSRFNALNTTFESTFIISFTSRTLPRTLLIFFLHMEFKGSTLTEYLESQDELLREAAEALPHSFSQCTFDKGSLKQAVYLCLNCPEARGLCSACSIACHTDHEQVELFPKRNFRCDCPTSAVAHPCSLHPTLEEVNTGNHYGQNFKSIFCRCGRPYDAENEKETMIQCLACEDWFHESCCNLRERPCSRDNTPIPKECKPSPDATEDQSAVIDDAASEASSTGLPPPLISGDDYEAFLCGSCTLQNITLRRWAGTHGVIMVVRDGPTLPWRRFESDGREDGEETVNIEAVPSLVKLGKRPSTILDSENPDPKRLKASSVDPSHSHHQITPCLAPPQNPFVQKVLSALSFPDFSSSLGTADLFLTEGFRERWCHCDSCLPPLKANPYLLEDEEVFEPPSDPDSGLSLDELGMRALTKLPREKAINGIHAFNAMKDNLVKFLRPFAQDGKIVDESDVKGFFSDLEEAAKARKI
ncbi:hypothetical protein CPB83DRAFT_856573 [Crepidotus variabilis]|uniref:UBR-type domain-containing protein n=1 Tax=Crepidotus variabilis TaxID=179855 RepID=A0A9P6EE29_9AGAR|nr:hypothetical protein CPB83DRAFT_856573 [Crepidotus variabilis]